MADSDSNLVSAEVMIQNETWEPLAGTEVIMFDPEQGIQLASAISGVNGLATFTDIVAGTVGDPTVPAFKLRSTRNSKGDNHGVSRLTILHQTVPEVVCDCSTGDGSGLVEVSWGAD